MATTIPSDAKSASITQLTDSGVASLTKSCREATNVSVSSSSVNAMATSNICRNPLFLYFLNDRLWPIILKRAMTAVMKPIIENENAAAT